MRPKGAQHLPSAPHPLQCRLCPLPRCKDKEPLVDVVASSTHATHLYAQHFHLLALDHRLYTKSACQGIDVVLDAGVDVEVGEAEVGNAGYVHNEAGRLAHGRREENMRDFALRSVHPGQEECPMSSPVLSSSVWYVLLVRIALGLTKMVIKTLNSASPIHSRTRCSSSSVGCVVSKTTVLVFDRGVLACKLSFCISELIAVAAVEDDVEAALAELLRQT